MSRLIVTALPLLLAACVSVGGGRGSRRDAPPGREGPAVPAWLEEVVHPASLPRPAPAVELEIVSQVRKLASEDFGTYSGAARALVTLGEPAVPYIGCAATREDCCEAVAGRAPVVLRTILGDVSPNRVALYFESSYRPVRLAAIRVAGERRMSEHAARLVRLLDDGDPAVRRAGVTALRRISNRFFGFRAEATASRRAAAVARWREFWGVTEPARREREAAARNR